MNRLYIRYLLLVLLGLSVMVWLADQVYLSRQQQAPAPETLALHQMLNAYCQQNVCAPERALHGERIRFLAPDQLALPPAERQALNAGNPVRAESDTGEYVLYLKAGDLIAQLGPFQDDLSETHHWYTRLFYLFLGLSILFCLWPLIRDLQQLKDAAACFARDRNPRHFKFPHSNFFTPVSDAMVWMGQRLARAVALQQELSATLSHELRTPITRLKFAVESLPSSCDPLLKQEFQEDLDELEGLVEEYLTFSRQEHERPLLDFEPVNLLELVSPRLQQLAKISGRQAGIEISRMVIAMADRRSLVRVFNNLIDNGIKYSLTQVQARLYQDGGEAVFVIEDDGPGLAGLGFEDIFLPYVRADGAQEVSGYGLGLAIVRKVVGWHEGSIVAGASSALGGARFELRLPALGTAVPDRPGAGLGA
ncbi:sensor histidine kinase [Microbulbifer pacificus]|uniref:sensor histidine kinase n=1 Tax=Microbulbifer pacificus TaxID=407164 RepID=UPI000CF46C15|nr:ATP-binding protein [Microbulbifer pacificus]